MKHLSNFDRTHFDIKDVYDHTYLINNTVNIEKNMIIQNVTVFCSKRKFNFGDFSITQSDLKVPRDIEINRICF